MSQNRGISAEDTVGPYYPTSFLQTDAAGLRTLEGLTVAPQGQPVDLRGVVLDMNNIPVAPVLIELWQADHQGRRRLATPDNDVDPWFSGHARIYSYDGHFDFQTIMPGVSAPEIDGGAARAPHVTINIYADGISRVATQIFFEGEAANAGDPLLQSVPESLRDRLIARHGDAADGVAGYDIAIVLRGESETPFFEDYCE